MNKKHLLGLGALFLSAWVHAQVLVKEPWVRATVPAQKVTGAFMQLESAQGGRLVAVSSPLAGTVEIHEMKLDQDLMKMKAIDSLDLPAGKLVELKPGGGYHLMLMNLKAQIKEGDRVPMTLLVQGADGKRHNIEIKAAVKALNAGVLSHQQRKP